MKKGDRVLIEATVDAFRESMNSGEMVRVKIGEVTVWIPYKDVTLVEEKK